MAACEYQQSPCLVGVRKEGSVSMLSAMPRWGPTATSGCLNLHKPGTDVASTLAAQTARQAK